MFESIDSVQSRLRECGYVCGKNISTVVFLAERLEKPVLVEGPAGVGKTELAKVVAAATGRDLIRLQCYEGLDEAKALYEWEYSKQLLYTQILKEKFSEAMAGTRTLREAADRIGSEDNIFFSERFIVPRPLLRAITAQRPTLLLVDEVDKSDPEFEAFLLEVLSDFQVSVPEVGTFTAAHRPLVFLTSNDAREMTDALKRRCLHLFIDFPTEEEERRILDVKLPGIDQRLADELVGVMQRLRKLHPSQLDDGLVRETLNVILKYEGDIRKAQSELGRLIVRKAEEKRAEPAPGPTPPAPAPPKKGTLH